MSTVEIPSFPFADGLLALETDPQELPEGATEEEGSIDLLEAGGHGTVRLALEVKVDDELLARVIPESELEDPPVRVVVVEQSDQGRIRVARELEGKLPGRATGEWEQDLGEVFGVISLTPMLVRTAGGGNPPYASHEGAILATGEPFEVLVDERPPRAGNYLDIRFVSFREEGRKDGSTLAGLEDLVYYLDTSDGDSAILYLNSDVDDLRDTLNAPVAPRGVIKRIKESTFSGITAHVWEQLASRALAEVKSVFGDEQVDPGEGASVDFVPEWAADVIRELASSIYENRTLEANIAELEEALVENRPGLDNLIGQFSQRQAEPAAAFRGLMLVRERRA